MKTLIKFLCASLFILPLLAYSADNTETAIFAGGCFWTMQYDFDQVNGVIKTTVGYTGGTLPNPSYTQVERGDTGHYEAIKIIYDPDKVSYQNLLNVYWHTIDPANGSGQFCDTGSQYRPAIFYLDADQKQLADESKQAIVDSKKFTNVFTQILPAGVFYPAEEYHQKFYLKNPYRFNFYEDNCGRDEALKVIWGFTQP